MRDCRKFYVDEVHKPLNSARLYLLGAILYLQKKVAEAAVVANRTDPVTNRGVITTQKVGTRALLIIVLVYERSVQTWLLTRDKQFA
jgi:hypothetical protein